MKKLIVLIMALGSLFALSSCTSSKQEQVSVYSFCGKNEHIAISNGVIVLSDTKDVFYGGSLEFIDSDTMDNIESYCATFYTIRNEEQTPILIDELVNQSSVEILSIDLGKQSSTGSDVDSSFEHIVELQNNFWCEFKMTDLNGVSKVYMIELTLTEITN